MSDSIGLTAHIIRVRKMRAKDERFCEIRRGIDPDVWQRLQDLLIELKAKPFEMQYSVEGKSPRATTRVLRLNSQAPQVDLAAGTISGVLEYGERGRSSVIVDPETSDEKYRCGIRDATMQPFYFRMIVPNGGETRSLLVCQQNGIIGPSSTFRRALHKHLAVTDWLMDDTAVVEEDMLDDYLRRGVPEEIAVRAHKLSKDRRTLLAKSRIAGEKLMAGTRVELVLKRREGLFAKAIRKIDRRAIAKLVEVSGMPNPDEVTVKVKDNANGKRRTFRLINPGNEAIIRDITTEVVYDTGTNHPTYSSIDAIASEWANELWERLD